MAELTEVLLRVDGGPEIGAGHVMRCLALAQALILHGRGVTAVSVDLAPGLRDRLTAVGVDCIAIIAPAGSPDDAAASIAVGRDIGATVAVLDGYAFAGDYQKIIRESGLRTLVIDDDGTLAPYCADVIVNQNPGATPALYGQADARLLLGADYVLLRDEFLAARSAREIAPDPVGRLLITLGGADPLNITPRLLQRLAITRTGPEIVVLTGAANPQGSAIRALVLAGAGAGRIEVIDDALNMAALMNWADVGVISAGTTMWEAAHMGLPSVAVVVADNQLASAAWYRDHGCGLAVDARDGASIDDVHDRLTTLLADRRARAEFASRGRRQFDGLGRRRLCAAIDELAGHPKSGATLTLRPATMADSDLLLDWRNDSVTRENSKSCDPIFPAGHRRWLATALESPDRELLVAIQGEAAVGTVRADRRSDGWMLSWTIAPAARGLGIGRAMVRQAVGRFSGTLSAEIKADNRASIRIAQAIGMTAIENHDDLTVWRLRR